MSDKQVKVLLVEDHPLIASLTADMIAGMGYTVLGPVGSIHEARQSLGSDTPHLALVDLNLPDGDGSTLASELMARGIKCVVLSAMSPQDVLPEVPAVLKPISRQQLKAFVDEIC